MAVIGLPLFSASKNSTDLSQAGPRASADSPPVNRSPAQLLTPELRGDIYMARKMYLEAVDFYRECPPSPGISNKIGIAFHEMSRLQLAKKYYEQAIKMDHNYAEAINNLGTLYYSELSYGKAIGYFKRSLKCSGPVASVYANLGAAYFARHNYEKASVYYEEALKLDPDVLEHHSGFGTRIQDRGVNSRLFSLDEGHALGRRIYRRNLVGSSCNYR